MARHLPRSGNVTPIPCDYGESGRSDKSNRTWTQGNRVKRFVTKG
jgi:hypothetical protein